MINKAGLVDAKKLLLGILIAFLVFISRGELRFIGISDALAIAGIIILLWAVAITANNLGFYNLILYSTRKFIAIYKNKNFTNSKSQSYYDFLASRDHVDSKGLYIIAGIFLSVSYLLAIVF